MKFPEIIAESKRKSFVFILNGVQANILLLILEMVDKDDCLLAFGGEFSDGVKSVLGEIRDRIGGSLKGNRFITLEEMKKLASRMSANKSDCGEKEIQDLVELIWNSRA